ncbi:MAG: 50S ribosomal protein L11 methyltransferase [Deltaproteobacteria bacterium]|nr:50S ribosomal protein L11 methyltransferase [Deltaproteobacteria bacterium]
MEYYFERYADLELQRRMVGDRPRTNAFHRAIHEVVRPGDAVLDVGTGTGILSLFAAQAGAERVYAVDQSPVIRTARQVFARHPEYRIEALEGPAASTRPPRPVQVLISEWLGNLAFVEGMLDAVLAARDHSLSAGGQMVPSEVEVWVAPLDDVILYHQWGPGFWRDRVHGLDLSALEAMELEQARAVQCRIESAALVAPGVRIAHLDLLEAHPGDWWQSGESELHIRRDGVLSGFVGWFRARLSPNVWLETGPGEPDTHWAQTYVTFPPRTVKQGEVLKLRHALEPDPDERRYLRLVLELGGERLSYRVE